MIIKAPQLKAARRYARRLGEQIGSTLDSGHDRYDGVTVEALHTAWANFIAQFSEPDEQIVRDYVIEGFRIGINGVSPHLEMI